jgi:hypothetical protein
MPGVGFRTTLKNPHIVGDGLDLFHERLAVTARLSTHEPPHPQLDDRPLPTDSQVQKPPLVTTMNPTRPATAPRTERAVPGDLRLNPQARPFQSDPEDDQRGEVREQDR